MLPDLNKPHFDLNQPRPQFCGPNEIVACPRCHRRNRLYEGVVADGQRCGACDEYLARKTALLLDVSSSMIGRAGAKRKIDILKETVEDIHSEIINPLLITFASRACIIQTPSGILRAGGVTLMHLAIKIAAEHFPARTLIISDGMPQNKPLVYKAIKQLHGEIDVIYIGPDNNREAIDFMNSLTRHGDGNGKVVVVQQNQQTEEKLLPAMKQLLLS